jgi:metal-responsive CopG/Arc/MetJ family transcriptional regulator
MKTIQITIDEALLEKVDHVTREKKIARSQFIRTALEDALRQLSIEDLEQRQMNGYLNHPVTGDEFDVWESEQAWG